MAYCSFSRVLPHRTGASGLFFLLPESFFRFRGGLAAYFFFPPCPSPPLPSYRCQIRKGGGEDPGGRNNMPPDSPPMGVVNFLGVTAIQNLANVSSSGITALQNVAVVNSSRINFPRVLLRLPGKSAGIFLLPPGSFPPLPPYRCQVGNGRGGGNRGEGKYAARLPSEWRCQFLMGCSGSEPGRRQCFRDYNIAKRGGCQFISDYTMSASSEITVF